MIKKAILSVATVALSVGLFVSAGMADAKVNDDYNSVNCPQVPQTEVIIQTVYIIDGDVYVVDERVESHSVMWYGDFPVLN